MALDNHTFGSSKAAESLTKILEDTNDKKVSACISRFLASQNKIIKGLKSIQDKESRETLISIYKIYLDGHKIKVPNVVYTHALNVLKTKMKIELHQSV